MLDFIRRHQRSGTHHKGDTSMTTTQRIDLELTQANYNYAIHRLQVLLSAPSKLGSPEDVAIFELTHFIEDYETARRNESNVFEPYYLEA